MPQHSRWETDQAQWEVVVQYLQTGKEPPFASASKRQDFLRFVGVQGTKELILSFDGASGDVRATAREGGSRGRIYIPRWDSQRRQGVLRAFHEEFSFAPELGIKLDHCGKEILYNRVSSVFANISESDCADYVRACTTCSSRHSIKKGLDVIPVVAYGIRKHIQIDCVNLAKYSAWNEDAVGFMSIVDIFSRFLWTVVMFSFDGKSIAQALFDHFCVEGAPLVLQSDNGPEFENELVKKVASTFHVQFRHGTAYYPQSQGKVERVNQSVFGNCPKSSRRLQLPRWILEPLKSGTCSK
jgi:hypothetical protein